MTNRQNLIRLRLRPVRVFEPRLALCFRCIALLSFRRYRRTICTASRVRRFYVYVHFFLVYVSVSCSVVHIGIIRLEDRRRNSHDTHEQRIVRATRLLLCGVYYPFFYTVRYLYWLYRGGICNLVIIYFGRIVDKFRATYASGARRGRFHVSITMRITRAKTRRGDAAQCDARITRANVDRKRTYEFIL